MISRPNDTPGHPTLTDSSPTARATPDAVMNLDDRSTDSRPRFGSRLRAVREAQGLTLESCAQAIKLPSRVLRQLEADQYQELDYAVYLGGYIKKYARHLQLDEASIQTELDNVRNVPPALVATGGISRSRYLLERYTTAATYVVLTVVIVAPMIWLGVRGTLDRDLSHLSPLDASPVAQQDAGTDGNVADGTATTNFSPPRVTLPEEEQPLLASMAPFPGLGNTPPARPVATMVSAPVADSAVAVGHSLSLNLTAASWVEVTAHDGSRLEYGLLPAGSSKTWHSDQPLEVRIGNAVGAQVSMDGQPVALDEFRHANVVHFRVDVKDGKAVPVGA